MSSTKARVVVTFELEWDVVVGDGDPDDGDFEGDVQALRDDLPRQVPFGDLSNLTITYLQRPSSSDVARKLARS